MSKVTSLEHKLTQMCFAAEREAGVAYRAGDMDLYYNLRGQYEAYKTAARMVEKYFENQLKVGE